MALTYVTVFSFEILDPEKGRQHMPFKATGKTIAAWQGAKLIEGTGEEVTASALDALGRFYRHSHGWTLEQLQAIC